MKPGLLGFFRFHEHGRRTRAAIAAVCMSLALSACAGTPKPAEGCLEGITRQTVFDLADELQLEVEQGEVTADELRGAEWSRASAAGTAVGVEAVAAGAVAATAARALGLTLAVSALVRDGAAGLTALFGRLRRGGRRDALRQALVVAAGLDAGRRWPRGAR